MGLDQNAYVITGRRVKDEWSGDEIDEHEQLATWRKHPNLHGFMEQLWIEKGTPGLDPKDAGSMFGSDFNCVELVLTVEDINRLEQNILAGGLPATEGFFFGDDSDEYYRETDLEFCQNARKALADGQKVAYNSWW